MRKAKPKITFEPKSIIVYRSEGNRATILNECAFQGYKKLPNEEPMSEVNGVLIIDDKTIKEITVQDYMDELENGTYKHQILM